VLLMDFVLVMEFVQVGAVCKLSFQVGLCKLGCASRGCRSGCCGFLGFHSLRE
jgi:hypothetical protein